MNIQIKKFYYGDIPEENAGGNELKSAAVSSSGGGGGWPLWEVFIRSKQGLDHKHAGSLHATDASMAIENARDVYTRRQEGVSLWALARKQIELRATDASSVWFTRVLPNGVLREQSGGLSCVLLKWGAPLHA